LAWVEAESTPEVSCLITVSPLGGLFYRLLGKPVDDGTWEDFGVQLSGPEQFRGAFGWPDSPDIYVFWNGSGAILRTGSRAVGQFDFDSFMDLNAWLAAVGGMSLKKFSATYPDGTLNLYQAFEDYLYPTQDVVQVQRSTMFGLIYNITK